MRSFNSCLASVVLVALRFTFPSLIAASPVQQQNLQDLARRTAAGESPLGAGALNVLTRRKPQKDSTARILAAKKRAANKTKRAAAPIASVQALHYTSGEKAKYNSYIDTSCVKTSTCTTAQSNLDLPTANTVPYCFVLERKCIVVCDLGYLGPQADGSCTAVVKCPANPAHGVYVGKDCTLACDIFEGYEAAGSTCVNIFTSVDNCGSVGNVCAASYNGVGTAKCSLATCGLSCGAGYQQRTAPGGQHYCARA